MRLSGRLARVDPRNPSPGKKSSFWRRCARAVHILTVRLGWETSRWHFTKNKILIFLFWYWFPKCPPTLKMKKIAIILTETDWRSSNNLVLLLWNVLTTLFNFLPWIVLHDQTWSFVVIDHTPHWQLQYVIYFLKKCWTGWRILGKIFHVWQASQTKRARLYGSGT